MDKNTLILAVVGLIIAFLVIIMTTQGPYALAANFQYIVYLILIGVGITVLLYAYSYLTAKHPPNYPALVKADIKMAAKMSRNPFVDKLIIQGDTSYQGHTLGRVTGTLKLPYTVTNDKKWLRERTQQADTANKTADEIPRDIPLPKDLFAIEDTVFVIKEDGIGNILKPEYMVRAIGAAWQYVKGKNGELVKEKDGTLKRIPRPDMIQHSDLTGTVRLICNSVLPIGEYIYPNTSTTSTFPEQTQLADVDKKFGFTMMSVLGDAVDKAKNINSGFQMELDRKGLIDPTRPSPNVQQPER